MIKEFHDLNFCYLDNAKFCELNYGAIVSNFDALLDKNMKIKDLLIKFEKSKNCNNKKIIEYFHTLYNFALTPDKFARLIRNRESQNSKPESLSKKI